jgi:7,8-dihydropterin-6-yl-methyl-4-(beta-D-ribofuranosyl)aminobenzene 5'-phosphate synthase
VNIVETVKKQRGADSIRLVLGGFHMFQQEEPQIREQVAALRRLNVRRVMPAHCSGDLAKKIFAAVYGSDYEPLGAGKVLRLD